MDYPPNSKKAQSESKPEKKIERVTTTEPIKRKKSLGKQFSETFIGGDAKSAANYMTFGVLIPALRDALAEAASQGIERLIFGESKTGRRPSSLATGHVSYNRFSSAGPIGNKPKAISRRSRATHDFGEIVLQSRTEAEEVIDRLFDLVGRFDSATVADLYELVGIANTHTDHKWGWTDLRGASVTRIRNGYLLDLPEPEPLDY